MPYTPFATSGRADQRRFRVGSHVQFLDAPIQAKFVPATTTGTVTARVGYRAFEVTCDGHALAVIDFPENMRKCATQIPYAPPTKFISRRK